ncbi:MAG TPA: argininosuccinate lyase [Candidatus Saccharimonadales bacterium]|nr:argininosuccinate lyase [Candidatus Saccharimonadales bacterium]
MSKLWSNADKLSPIVETYTVGDDYILDNQLLPYDIEASRAHGKMLLKIGVLSEDEHAKITEALEKIKSLHAAGKFSVAPDQEDCHTAIEQFITENYGEAGKKIHTGRSRNDQAMAMLRLYAKDVLSEIDTGLQSLSKAYVHKAEEAMDVPMPGYTHMQKAMPTTVEAWLGGYAQAFSDLVPLVRATLELIDQNPLGSAAGFGLPGLELDKEYTTKELGFARTQENPIYAGLSRGYFELAVIQVCELIMTLSGRFASDMLLFTTREFDYFSLPEQFTTGSSIMPNKRNYDLFEIMRGNGKIVSGYASQIQAIVAGIGSGFQRDLQLSKGPFIKASELTKDTLAVLSEAVPALNIHEDKLKAAMSEDLYATEKVYELVGKGVPFREAYLKVKKELFGEEAKND